jgi:hypothetical protein
VSDCNHNFREYRTNDSEPHYICTKCGATDLDVNE